MFFWCNLFKTAQLLQTAGLSWNQFSVIKPLFIQWQTLTTCMRASIWDKLELIMNNKAKLLSCCVIIALLLLFHSGKF